MSLSTKEIAAALNDLVETAKDGEQGFREAAEGVHNEQLRQTFDKYSRQRAVFASQLQTEVSRIGGEPQESGSTSGAVHRGWINLKAAITGKNEHAILEEAERGEDVAVKAWREALAKDLPADMERLVRKQYDEILEAHSTIRNLRDSVPAAR